MRYVWGTLRFISTMIGIILMMCETPDWNKQIMVGGIGMLLFCIGVIPTIIKQAKESYEAKQETYKR